MDSIGLFRWLWRFNAIALALVLFAAGVGLALPFLSWQFGPVVETAVDTAAPGQPKPAKYRLALDYVRKGRTDIVFTLGYDVKPQPGLGSFSGSREYGRKVVNYLFVDPATGASRWLFPTHRQQIESTDYFTDAGLEPAEATIPGPGPVPGPSSALRTVMYDVVPNPDEPRDKWTYQVYMSAPDGSALTKVLDALDEQPKAVQLDLDSVVIAYRLKGKAMVARVSLADFKPTMQKDLGTLEAE